MFDSSAQIAFFACIFVFITAKEGRLSQRTLGFLYVRDSVLLLLYYPKATENVSLFAGPEQDTAEHCDFTPS